MTEPVAGPAGAALVDGAAGVVYSAPFLLAARAFWIHPGRGQVVPILSE
jgi:hypothetical protein